MSEDNDDSQKTEEPTHKRLEDARKKGNLPSSREVNSFFMMLGFAMLVLGLAPSTSKEFLVLLKSFIEAPHDIPMGEGAFIDITGTLLGKVALLMLGPFILAMVAALAGGAIQSKFNFSTEPMMPKFERISPMKGIERLFSMRSVVELLKGILKITIVGVVAYKAIEPNLEGLRQLPFKDIPDALSFLMTNVSRMLQGVVAVLFLIAIFDYLYQRHEYMKNLRMSKQELKEEYKQQEGDPHIKQKLRAIRMEKARKRMMAAVPDSDVVITNPTHYAVALKYDEATMNAPMIVAKGTDDVALRIRKLAEENKVPIMRNPPLARALYDNGELDKEVPIQHYQAVAKVIGYIYKLRGRVLRAPPKKK